MALLHDELKEMMAFGVAGLLRCGCLPLRDQICEGISDQRRNGVIVDYRTEGDFPEIRQRR